MLLHFWVTTAISILAASREKAQVTFLQFQMKNYKKNTSGIGCAHILHNAMHSRADILPTDIELIINKIFQYFHIYTVYTV
jgi:hypothetical protein